MFSLRRNSTIRYINHTQPKILTKGPPMKRKFVACKGIQDCFVFWIPRGGFRISGTGSFKFLVLGTWMSDSNRWRDSGYLELHSGFHKQEFPKFWILLHGPSKFCRNLFTLSIQSMKLNYFFHSSSKQKFLLRITPHPL